MKTVEDYAREYDANGRSKQALEKIALALIFEIKEIGEKKGIVSDDQFFPIIEEIEKKWEAFAAGFPEVRVNGFVLFLKEKVPNVYKAVMKHRREAY